MSKELTTDERVIPNSNGRYKISSTGVITRVVSTAKYRAGTQVKQFPNTVGYMTASLVLGGKSKTWSVHQLVLISFGFPRPSLKHECCHNDGNPLNNSIDNLRWGLPVENGADRKRHGRIRKGESVSWSKLTDSCVLEIRERYKNGETMRELAACFGCSSGNISAVVTKQTWKHISEVA